MLEALAQWVIEVTNKKGMATPEEIAALPEVSNVFFKNYSSAFLSLSKVVAPTSEDLKKIKVINLLDGKLLAENNFEELTIYEKLNIPQNQSLFMFEATSTGEGHSIGNRFSVVISKRDIVLRKIKKYSPLAISIVGLVIAIWVFVHTNF